MPWCEFRAWLDLRGKRIREKQIREINAANRQAWAEEQQKLRQLRAG